MSIYFLNFNKHQYLLAVIGLVLGSTQACTPSMAQMHQRFQYEVDSSIGSTLESSKTYPCRYMKPDQPNEVAVDNSRTCYGVVGTRTPTDVKNLQNGNVLYVYADYWAPIRRTPCDVFLEVNPNTDIVISAYTKGDGCFMPY